jgi:Undecaprenyl-phosphate glucose phosphotransferase
MSDMPVQARLEEAIPPPPQYEPAAEGQAKPRSSDSVARRFMATDRKAILIGLLRADDFIAAAVGALVTYSLNADAAAFSGECAVFGLLGAVLLVNYMHLTGSYSFEAVLSLPTQATRALLSWSTVSVTLLAISNFLGMSEGFPPIWFVNWFSLTLALLVISRLASASLLYRWRRNGRLSCRLAIVGSSEATQKVARRLAVRNGAELVTTLALDRPGALVHAPGVFLRGEAAGGCLGRGVPATCTIDDLLALSQAGRIDEIIVVPGTPFDPALHDVIRALRTLSIDVRVHALDIEQQVAPTRAAIEFGMPLYMIVERPLSGWASVAKRAEDSLISAVALVLLLPILATLAFLIKLESPGPIFFRQDRFGFNNDLIRVYKLRTMHHRPEPEGAVMQAQRNDPRVTRIGRILRRTSLDELPQLINVLKGEMSLVGPRPHPVALDRQFAPIIDNYLARHRVKPGITGWAQVNGLRGETDTLDKMQHRVEHDLYYIDNWSLLFDFRILLATLAVGFMNKNAY